MLALTLLLGHDKKVMLRPTKVFVGPFLVGVEGLTAAVFDDPDVFVSDWVILSNDLTLLSAFLEVPPAVNVCNVLLVQTAE